jgi:predicted dehydrogenase
VESHRLRDTLTAVIHPAHACGFIQFTALTLFEIGNLVKLPLPSKSTRRAFIRRSVTWTGGTLAASTLPAQSLVRKPSLNDKLNLAIVGSGGRGFENLLELQSENIVALCDVDDERAQPAFKKFPDAKRYRDFRRMLDRERSLDAVVVSTPDHTHATAAINAMQRGLHVYCEKPLAHSIYEVRKMAAIASQSGVFTQMGQQGHAVEGTRAIVEIVQAGLMGAVTEVHAWTDRPSGWWPQGEERPSDAAPVPASLDWDLWLGPVSYRPYHPVYLPFKWRGRWDFGTGAVGDMAVHNLDPAFWALNLGIPIRVEVKASSPATEDSPPLWSIIQIQYPARGILPPVNVTYYDGKKLPPAELFHGEAITDNGSLIIGEKGTIYTRTWHGGETDNDMFILLPRNKFQGFTLPKKTLPRAENHHREWVRACKGGPAALSDFSYASRLTEGLLVAVLALRTGRTIEWDSEKGSAKGFPEAERFIHPKFREGWNL